MKAVDIIVGMHLDEEWTVTSVEYALSNLVPAPPGHIHIADIVLVEMESPAYPMHAPNTGPKRVRRTWFRMDEAVDAKEGENRDEGSRTTDTA